MNAITKFFRVSFRCFSSDCFQTCFPRTIKQSCFQATIIDIDITYSKQLKFFLLTKRIVYQLLFRLKISEEFVGSKSVIRKVKNEKSTMYSFSGFSSEDLSETPLETLPRDFQKSSKNFKNSSRVSIGNFSKGLTRNFYKNSFTDSYYIPNFFRGLL